MFQNILVLAKNSNLRCQCRLNQVYHSYRYEILWKPSLSHKDKLEPEIIRDQIFFFDSASKYSIYMAQYIEQLPAVTQRAWL